MFAYPTDAVRQAFAEAVRSVGAYVVAIDRADGMRGERYYLTWADDAKRWAILQYRFSVGSEWWAYLIGTDATRPI